ncbi:LuxR C-terminal-related transcriptional regulator [Micromonospora zamorensis]|uniref:helix-turn-helix transcriptional regulator n=1 Tax=Micromonospora zamorensis TaxID=709883 RepID=UPI003253A5AC|nr:LuxR C-terminal-related transcriptional regulator [Micromonospora zamorensis]
MTTRDAGRDGETVRRREIRVLLTTLHAVRAERSGRVIELVGEPGSGKSRLIAIAAREAARSGIRSLNARCTEADRGKPLLPLLHVLISQGISVSSLDTEPTAASPDGWHQPLGVYAEIRQALAELARDGALLALDDFHFADDDSVRLVENLVRTPVPGLLLVVALRARQASAQLLEVLAHGAELGSVRRLHLDALSVKQAAGLLGLPPEDERLRHLHAESGGVPAYLLELAHGSTGVTPARQQRSTTLLAEMSELNADERVTISAAAVLGGVFDLELLSHVAGLPHARTWAAMTGLRRRDLVRPVDHPAGYALRHRVVRDFVYAGADPTWRTIAHRKALELLTDRRVPVADRAGHIEQLLTQPQPQPASPLLLAQAGEDALMEDPEAAARWLRAALRPAPGARPNDTVRLRLSLAYARALIAIDEPAEARRVLRELLASTPGGPPDLRSAAVAVCAQLDWLLGLHAEAGSLIRAELGRSAARPPLHAIPMVVTDQFVQGRQGNRAAMKQAAWCVRTAREQGDRVGEVGALTLAATHQMATGDLLGAQLTLRQCGAIADQIADSDLTGAVEYLAILGWAEHAVDSFADARRHLRRSAHIARRGGQRHLLPFILVGLSRTYLAMGPIDKAQRASREARDLAEPVGFVSIGSVAQVMEACSALELGLDAAEAIELAEEAASALPIDESWWRTDLTISLAEAVLTAGDAQRCVTLLIETGGPRLDRLPLAKRSACFELIAQAAADLGDPVTAGECARLAEDIASTTLLPSHLAQARAAHAHEHRARRQPDEAWPLYRQAADSFAEAGMTRAQARMLTTGVSCMPGDPETARPATSMLSLSRELARRSAAWRLYRQAEALQQHLEVAGRQDEPAREEDPLRETLTAREYQVARIAADGKRTKEIAEQLRLSSRTVEAHLSNIYRKLEVNSRAALASKVARAS